MWPTEQHSGLHALTRLSLAAGHLSVKPPRAAQRGVDCLRPVGGPNHDDCAAVGHSIHEGQQGGHHWKGGDVGADKKAWEAWRQAGREEPHLLASRPIGHLRLTTPWALGLNWQTEAGPGAPEAPPALVRRAL